MGTGINNLSDLIALHAELTALLNKYDTPTANPKLLERINHITAQVQYLDEYSYRCLLRLQRAAEIYYSPAKHKNKYYGADEHHAKMRDALSNITARIAEIKATQGK